MKKYKFGEKENIEFKMHLFNSIASGVSSNKDLSFSKPNTIAKRIYDIYTATLDLIEEKGSED